MMFKFEHSKPSREDKGNSLLSFPDDYIVLDLETTGFDSIYDYIIEIGAIKFVNNIEVSRFHRFINVPFEIDDFIINLTGISNDMLKNGVKIKQAIYDLDLFIQNNIIVAHNANFDVNFLYDNYKNILEKSFPNDFVDTMRVARRLYRNLNRFTLTNLLNNFGYKKTSIHRAMDDCDLLNVLYQHMKNEVIKNVSLIDLLQTKRKKINLDNLKPSDLIFDEDNLFFNKTCVFTGKLEKMIRKDAWQTVLDLGGKIMDVVNKTTDYLILGNLDYHNKNSGKLQKARELILKGYNITIISENSFYDMVFYKL